MSNTIITVDDSITIRNLLNKILIDAGYTVRQAIDGLDGVQLVKSLACAPAAIITDLNMPRMDGYEFISNIRILDLTKKTPILVLTTEMSQEKKFLREMRVPQVGSLSRLYRKFLCELSIV
ncbi:response regulator [Acetobacter sacchari]|uniref:response regulator n=1 Tax=Acetobacter sacchari TaxID=2661687 RepID=UPI002435E0CC|nr:response regulator [Acetobacter sacchari]